MLQILKKNRWSPYTVGVGIGILSWLSFLIAKKVIGTSTIFVVLSGLITKLFYPEYVNSSTYYQTYLSNQPIIGWGFVLVIFLFIRSFVASILGNSRTKQHVPQIWKDRFGSSYTLRYFWSVIGGILLGFGTRLAGGCTSGHSISGGLMLALSGWVFTLVLFAIGVISAFLIYKTPFTSNNK